MKRGDLVDFHDDGVAHLARVLRVHVAKDENVYALAVERDDIARVVFVRAKACDPQQPKSGFCSPLVVVEA